MNSVNKFLSCHIMGLTAAEYDVLSESSERHQIGWQAIAIMLASISLGYLVFAVLPSLFGAGELGAAISGLFIAITLFLFERNQFIMLRTAEASLRTTVLRTAFFMRFIILLMLVIGSVLNGLNKYDDAIQAQWNKEKAALRTALESNSRFSQPYADAQAALQTAQGELARRNQLLQEANQLQVEQAFHLTEYHAECEGLSVKGKARRKGCGDKANSAKVLADEANFQANAKRIEITALGDVDGKLTRAQNELGALRNAMDIQISEENKGFALRLEAFWHLLVEHPFSSLLPIVFSLLISSMPEVYLIVAYATAMTALPPVLATMNKTNEEAALQKESLRRQRQRLLLSANLPVLDVSLNGVVKTKRDGQKTAAANSPAFPTDSAA